MRIQSILYSFYFNVGMEDADFRSSNCFWLTRAKKDSVYLFADTEIQRFTNPLLLSEMITFMNFSMNIVPSKRPVVDEIDNAIDLLLKIKLGS